MTIWIDAQLSPTIAFWIKDNFAVQSFALRELGLRDSEDIEIFEEAKKSNAVILTKDSDFISLLERFDSPPKIIWLTCGNTSNSNLKRILSKTLQDAINLLESGETFVEIN
jgi:predicted nuclease of predicted toxin-antitoxin system